MWAKRVVVVDDEVPKKKKIGKPPFYNLLRRVLVMEWRYGPEM